MVLQVEQQRLTVENVRNHPAEAVENLRALLAAGAVAQPDPHRKDFFEVQNGTKIYYVHVAPATGKVLLLGIWPKREENHDSAAD